jgi:cellulose synthase/poly-beta-1,6-N-acetylglucosamine synthase-like glycosyltransferase
MSHGPALVLPPISPPIDARLDEAVNGLRRATPELSAQVLLTPPQRIALVAMVAATTLAALLDLRSTLITLLAAANVLYLAAGAYRVVLFVAGLRPGSVITVSDAEARAIADADLPIYTVLLPAYHEPGIVAELVRGVSRIDYPRSRLEVKLILEADDLATVAAAAEVVAAGIADLVLVPPAEPRTKPKACNYALAEAHGEFVTIYDAEDIPEPLQLRKAVAAFRRVPPEVACLQARLAYYNDDQNLLTRWFAIEYLTWFANMLPGLAALGAPIPLGGTSNHLRTGVLRANHGWDAFNVTEDADLGIRLARAGYRCAILDSETLEEANSDSINWTKQRSRWTKGYLQTGLIHFRNPRRLVADLGIRATVSFLLTVFGAPIMALLNPVMWALCLAWWFGTPAFVAELFPAWLYYPCVVSLLVGNFVAIYINLAAVATRGLRHLIVPCLIIPLYWGLMALGAVKALVQLVTAPSYWEKTTHGLAPVRD